MNPFVATCVAYGIIALLLWGTAAKLFVESWNLRR